RRGFSAAIRRIRGTVSAGSGGRPGCGGYFPHPCRFVTHTTPYGNGTGADEESGQHTAPLAVAAGMAADVARSRRQLILENALLRQQVVILHRPAKRPRLTALDRGLLVPLAGRLSVWAQALVIVRPETVPRLHRQEFLLLLPPKSTSLASEVSTP